MSTPPSKPPQSPEIPTQTAIPEVEHLPEAVSPETGAPEYIDLPQGKELNEAAASDLAKSRPVRWIVLAGPTDSGKTTLLTSLYELFQWRQVEKYIFAASNTLPGFEERCYLSRRASGNVEPHTQRTRYRGANPVFLHLRIRSIKGLRPFRDFLFTDVSGEMFEHARDSEAECKELTFLKRANHFLVFLDCEKGVQESTRWAMVEDGRALLRNCIDSQMIGSNCIVSFVWSRFDYFEAKKADNKHRRFRTDAEKQLRTTFGRQVPNLKFAEVAARPLKAPELRIGYGIQALLNEWATAMRIEAPDLFPTSYSGTRESELFAARYFASIKANGKSGT